MISSTSSVGRRSRRNSFPLGCALGQKCCTRFAPSMGFAELLQNHVSMLGLGRPKNSWSRHL
jgi:hypothetical protein